ncbi:MAG: alpha-L-fucosidase, partial [Firmicutes bacterium]|nr:alpha-L-fucosidase [Bacillota bacterium]
MQKFDASFDSLQTAGCPDWFRDAKFGIWSHWGPQSVPMYGDWYARNMYIQDTPQYIYHVRHYGHPSKFGYKDVCALWKAENFNPGELMELYHKAGARYFVAQAMHHDNFFNFPSKLNPMNSAQVGPMKDICGLWKQAADKFNMPFGLTEHHGASFSWWRVNKGCDTHGMHKGVPYDGNDPAWQDFYYPNQAEGTDDPHRVFPWYTEDAAFRQHWLGVMKELIDLYTPELLYTDGNLPFGNHLPSGYQAVEDGDYSCGLEAVAYLYNKSIEKYGTNRAIYTHKDRRPEVHRVGILDIEKSQLPGIAEKPWQTDTCIGNWFYDVRQKFKTADHVVEMLVDIISKNGTMLLNILQKPDGTIDDESRFLLNEMAEWFNICSEGVYETRPWKVAGEGIVKVAIEGFREDKTAWHESDFRFVQKHNTVYAFMLGNPK